MLLYTEAYHVALPRLSQGLKCSDKTRATVLGFRRADQHGEPQQLHNLEINNQTKSIQDSRFR